MKLEIEVELGNDAMQKGTDVILALTESFAQAHKGFNNLFFCGEHGKLMDVNGNTVGSWEVTE